MRRASLLGALLLFSLPSLSAAQVPVSEYAARRSALAARIGEGVVVGFGAAEPVTDDAEFRQLPAFSYLTGFEEPNAAFLMVVRDGRASVSMLYVPKRDPR